MAETYNALALAEWSISARLAITCYNLCSASGAEMVVSPKQSLAKWLN